MCAFEASRLGFSAKSVVGVDATDELDSNVLVQWDV